MCAGIEALWLVSLPLWADLKEWQTAIHTVASVLTLLLVVLLENAGRRKEQAAQEKLNVIAEAVAELMASEARNDLHLRDAAERLCKAVGLEERHLDLVTGSASSGELGSVHRTHQVFPGPGNPGPDGANGAAAHLCRGRVAET